MIGSNTLHASIDSGSRTWSTVPLIFNFHQLKNILTHKIRWWISCHVGWTSSRNRSSSWCRWYLGTSSNWSNRVTHMTSVIFQLRRFCEFLANTSFGEMATIMSCREISKKQSWASHWIWPWDQLCCAAKPNRNLFDARFSTDSIGYQTLWLETSDANSISRTIFSWPPSDKNSATENRKSVIIWKQFQQLSMVFILTGGTKNIGIFLIENLPERTTDSWTCRYGNTTIAILTKFDHWTLRCSEISPESSSKLHLRSLVAPWTCKSCFKADAFWLFWPKVKIELIFSLTLKIFWWIEKSFLVSLGSIDDGTVVSGYCELLILISIMSSA